MSIDKILKVLESTILKYRLSRKVLESFSNFRNLGIWAGLLKKFLMENFILYAVRSGNTKSNKKV